MYEFSIHRKEMKKRSKYEMEHLNKFFLSGPTFLLLVLPSPLVLEISQLISCKIIVDRCFAC